MLGDYKLKFVRTPMDEFEHINRFDPIMGDFRKTKNLFKFMIVIKIKTPTTRNKFYNFGRINLSFAEFAYPSSYVIKLYWDIDDHISNYEPIPQIVQDNTEKILNNVFIDGLGFQKEDEDTLGSLIYSYTTRKSSMTKAEIEEFADELVSYLNEQEI